MSGVTALSDSDPPPNFGTLEYNSTQPTYPQIGRQWGAESMDILFL